jgi:hypothetical protein
MPMNLDTPPPPPQLTPAASLKGLAGGAGEGQDANASLDGSSQKVVMEHMMEVEKLLGRISDIKPDAAPIVSDLIEQMRVRLGKALIQPQSQPASAPTLASLATGGAQAPTPTM